jgi:hypothetical protein
VIGIDFSLANLTFDETNYCNHTMKGPNDYADCLQSVQKGFNYFSRFTLAYGFGARTFLDDDGPACNLFTLTGDFMTPCVDNIVDNYRSTLKNVKLSLPVMYKNILQIVCDLAQDELGSDSSGDPLEDIRKVKNYYVLTLLMAGMIDDFKDSLDEMLRAANLPISIIVVKIGKNNKEDNDHVKFMNQCKVAF